MFRLTGSGGDAFAKFPQQFQLPTRWGGHMASKLGACAHFLPTICVPLPDPAEPSRVGSGVGVVLRQNEVIVWT